jgi:hypothetical protein
MNRFRPLAGVAMFALACTKSDPATATEVLPPGPGACFRPWVVTPASVSVSVGDTTRFRVTSNCVIATSVADRNERAAAALTVVSRP